LAPISFPLFHGLHFGAGEIDSSRICIIVLLVAGGEEDHDASGAGTRRTDVRFWR
jgi:hypothetical protein